jgi:DNA-binding response OmpR family regulator
MNTMHMESSSQVGGVPIEAEPARRIWTINVLLVDDDPADTSLIAAALRRHPGVSAFRSSADPRGVLRELAEGRIEPDLVLLDIKMPRMDGFTFLTLMREIPESATTPVVLLTTSGFRRDAEEALASTAVSYVIKPHSFSQLQARLDTAIRRTIAGDWRKLS